MTDSKKCRECGEIKPLSDYTKISKSKDGLNYRCKYCCRKLCKQNYEKNREKHIERVKSNIEKNREKYIQRGMEYYKKQYNPSVYKLYSPSTDYYYIGMSNQPTIRCKQHINNMENQKYKNPILQQLWNDGVRDWVFEVIDSGDENDMLILEGYLIEKNIDGKKCCNIRKSTKYKTD